MDKMAMNCLLGIVCLTFCFHFSQGQAFSSYARTCANCNTTSRATCEPNQGVVICSCKPGFIGDGLNCSPMVFCDTVKCCPSGYTWDDRRKQCVDINECNDVELNKCSPADTCVNRNGIYLCAMNRNRGCGGSDRCSNDMDCLDVNGNAQCADPCYNYNTINGTNRLHTLSSPGRFETDRYKFGWFRYVGNGVSLREGCVGALKCGSMQPFSLAGRHPSIGDGIVMSPLLSNTISLGCVPGPSIPVKACPDGYYVYKYSGSLRFDVYCTDTIALAPATVTTPTTTTTTIPTTIPTTTTPTTTPTTTTPTTIPTTTTPTTIPTTTTPTTIPTTTTPIPTTTAPTTIPTTTTPTTATADAIEGSGSDAWPPETGRVTRSRVRRALYTRSVTTTTSTTTSTPSTTLSAPARELLEALGHLKALVGSMSNTLSESDRKWINNKVSQITQHINELDPATINAALNNFSSELIPAVTNLLSNF